VSEIPDEEEQQCELYSNTDCMRKLIAPSLRMARPGGYLNSLTDTRVVAFFDSTAFRVLVRFEPSQDVSKPRTRKHVRPDG
jgi:hypothetical protein